MRPPDGQLFFPDRDIGTMLDLRAAVWGEDHPHTTRPFMEWLYAANSASAPQGAMVRRPDGEPVAFAGLCVKQMKIDDQVIRLAHGLDYMIRPGRSDLISGRVAVKVARDWISLAKDLRCDYGLVFPNDSSNRILTSKHVGLAPVFSPALLIRPLGQASPERRLHKRLPRPFGTLLLRGAAVGSAMAANWRPRSGEAVELDRFGDEFDDLWSRVAPSFRVALVRDAAYLNWRYLNHPVYDYHRFAWRQGGRLQGFAAASPRQLVGVKAMLLIELFAAPWDGPAMTGLIRTVIDDAARMRQDMVASLAVPGSRLYRTLLGHGFYPVPRWLVPRFFHTAGIAFEPNARAAMDPANWHFAWGDTDVV